MKTLHIRLLTVAFIAVFSTASANNSHVHDLIIDHHIQVTDSSGSEKVKSIRLMVAKIDNDLPKYRKVTISNVDGESTEGNEHIKYFENENVKKIIAIYYGETGKALEEYYFDNTSLIFFYRRENRYEVPINVNSSVKIASTEEKRYYFYNGKLFLAKLGTKQIVSATELSKLSAETNAEAKRQLNLKQED
jgi:hypothetical protein